MRNIWLIIKREYLERVRTILSCAHLAGARHHDGRHDIAAKLATWAKDAAHRRRNFDPQFGEWFASSCLLLMRKTTTRPLRRMPQTKASSNTSSTSTPIHEAERAVLRDKVDSKASTAIFG